MKKYLNEKNINFVADLATNYDNGFNLKNAVELCIDEWYLGNPIDEHPEFGGVAKEQFNKNLYGKDYDQNGKTNLSKIMINALDEFFKEYIAPKYYLIQNVTYKYLDYLKNKDIEEIYSHYFLTFDEHKERHSYQILCLVKDVITDWKFGFDIFDEDDDYYSFEFDDDFNIDDIIAKANNDNDYKEEDIEEINIVCDYKDTPEQKVEKMPVGKSAKNKTKKITAKDKKKATTNKKKTTPTKKAAKKTN